MVTHLTLFRGCMIATMLCASFFTKCTSATDTVTNKNTNVNTEAMQSTTPQVRISTTYGDIVVRLYDETPEHRDNFLKLARNYTIRFCYIIIVILSCSNRMSTYEKG